MMPVGTYFGRPTSGLLARLGPNETPFLVVTFDIAYRAMDGNWQALSQAEQRDVRICVSEKSWPYATKKLTLLGFNGNFRAPAFNPENDSRGVSLACVHTERDGKTYEQWDLADWGGREYELAPEDVARTLDAKWKRDAGGYSERPAPPPPTAPEPHEAVPAGPPPGDDIPF